MIIGYAQGSRDRIGACCARQRLRLTVNRELAALKRMLRLGHRARKVGRIPHVQLLAQRNRRKGFFEVAQFQAVLDHLPADLKPLAEVAYITGWRIASELAHGDRWEGRASAPAPRAPPRTWEGRSSIPWP